MATSTPHGDNLQIVHLDYKVEYADGAAPPSTITIASDKLADESIYADALRQSWTWDDARSVLPECRYSIGVIDMLSSGLDYKDRMTIIHNVLKALVSAAPCAAMCWKISGQFIDPAAYLEAMDEAEPNLLYGALNVRLFNIQNRPGEILMDTLGLAALGLPDIQCHGEGRRNAV